MPRFVLHNRHLLNWLFSLLKWFKSAFYCTNNASLCTHVEGFKSTLISLFNNSLDSLLTIFRCQTGCCVFLGRPTACSSRIVSLLLTILSSVISSCFPLCTMDRLPLISTLHCFGEGKKKCTNLSFSNFLSPFLYIVGLELCSGMS